MTELRSFPSEVLFVSAFLKTYKPVPSPFGGRRLLLQHSSTNKDYYIL